MKSMKAVKCKNCWFVSIIETRTITTESDVLKLIREKGLKVRKEFSGEKRIYAD